MAVTDIEKQKMKAVLDKIYPSGASTGEYYISGLKVEFLPTSSKGWFINGIEFALPLLVCKKSVWATINSVAHLKSRGMLVH